MKLAFSYFLAASVATATLGSTVSRGEREAPVRDSRIAAAYGDLPMSFTANQGQTDAVQLMARGHALAADDRVGFDIDEYDPTHPLVIDPVLSSATFLGGNSNDIGHALRQPATC